MLHNHIFWITQALLFSSALNINSYLEYSGTNKILKKSIGAIGALGLIAGSIRFLMLSFQHNWWWFFGGIGTFLLGVGVFSYIYRSKIKDVLGVLNLLVIPFLWCYGSRFNTMLNSDWFYDLVNTISNFLP